MISRELLRHIVIQQKARIEKPGDFIERSLFQKIMASIDDDRILILAGIRRCGKSTLLQAIKNSRAGCCYANFEDERLLSFQAEDFSMLDEILHEVYGTCSTYFFDEVQNVEKFETFVRRLQDDGKKVVLTGSNAALLSQEFGTRLTGRYKLFEVYPFSFPEYLRFRKIRLSADAPYLPEEKAVLVREFRQYMEIGGMPEYLRNNETDYLRTLYENILYRDIIARFSIRRQRLVRELVGILASTLTLPFTYNSLKKTLGLTNAITVKEYISYLSGAYLYFELARFDYSVKKQLGAPRKIYGIDTAMSTLAGFTLTPDKGRLLENIVYIELRRKGYEIFYFSKDRECDFIIRDGRKIVAALQICYEVGEQNRTREMDGLLGAMEEFDLSEGTILTFDQEDELHVKGKTIVLLPVWKWLFEENRS